MKKIHVVLISIHGLFRGENPELGRDSDTGGQTLYVLELAKALAKHPQVQRVDLFTRRIVDLAVDEIYSQPFESIADNAWIVRVDAGPEGYIRKEELWDHLDTFADNMIHILKNDQLTPSVVHSHYADAGYVGVQVSNRLGCPLIHTGHSLGRDKRGRLLASGVSIGELEERFNMLRRIEAEEAVLGAADLVITSTNNEIREQYSLYDHYQPEYMWVNPPGVNLVRFHPGDGKESPLPFVETLRRFLRNPDKPMVLALSRPDQRKNIGVLLDAFGRCPELAELANLVIITGSRNDIANMDTDPQNVLTGLILKIDLYDLYGKVAYPKQITLDEVAELYRHAAATGGVFVNPALTEPFGLTLLEAAASGLPIVATQDGGPQDIIANCKNGELIDPLDPDAIAQTLLLVILSKKDWQQKAENGLKNVRLHYSWDSHVDRYVERIHPMVDRIKPQPRPPTVRKSMLFHDRAIFSDMDQNLLGDLNLLKEFNQVIASHRRCSTFGIATGRSLESALNAIRKNNIPMPDVLIANLGTDIYYAPHIVPDIAWRRHIDHLWTPKEVRRILAEMPGLTRQPENAQSTFKLSYYYDAELAPPVSTIISLLHQHDQTVRCILAFGRFLDIIPIRASKGQALRYFADQWDIPLQNILAAGGSGADEDMITGNTIGVVVANRFNEELSQLVDRERIYFAQKPYSSGILEAIDHFDFFGACEIPRSRP